MGAETRSPGAIRQANYRARQKAGTPSRAPVPDRKAGLKKIIATMRMLAATNAPRPPAIDINDIYQRAKPMPGVLPSGTPAMAMDEFLGAGGEAGWMGAYGQLAAEGITFLGYPFLAQLAQRTEYRRAVEIIAEEMTRKWIRLEATGDDAVRDGKADKIKAINAELDRLNVREIFRLAAEADGYFGRAHIYLDTGDGDDPDELKSDIGDGLRKLSVRKVRQGDLKALRVVEPMWTYPSVYNATDPLKATWYAPEVWFVMGKQVHASRMLTLVAREVPDILKPTYSFGGLSLTQMLRPYVENWTSTRQSVNDMLQGFSQFVLKTSMDESLQVSGELLNVRAELFNNLRNSRGLMLLDKDLEEFENISVPLSGLSELQAQSQEHISAAAAIPLVKYLGVTPSGLNASSDGEIRVFYDSIGARQRSLFGGPLKIVLNFVQLSLFGEVDPEITFEFEPLWELDGKEQAEVQKLKAETGTVLIDAGVIAPNEERARVAADRHSGYDSIDPEEMPDLRLEEEAGLAVPHEEGDAALEHDDIETRRQGGGAISAVPPAERANG